jgi:uncharacterized protein YebE (UPF0316 family)
MEATLMTILVGILVTLSRVIDVTLGTIRTISIVHGRVKTAFVLGFFESAVWLVVVAGIINVVREQPILGVFYAFGFALGNMVGILIERRLAFGHAAVRIVSPRMGDVLVDALRAEGYSATTFQGDGLNGPVTMIYIVTNRRDISRALKLVRSIDPEAFYIAEQAGLITKSTRPIMPQRTGWRGVLKKK